MRLVDAIEKEAAKLDVVQDILLEVNIGAEASKSGAAPGEVRAAQAKAQKAGAFCENTLRVLAE